jgi:hypothetical protein
MRNLLASIAIIAAIMSVVSVATLDLGSETIEGSKILPVPIPRSSSVPSISEMDGSASPRQSLGSPEPPLPENPPGPEDRAEYMIGTVAVTVIFPESNGALDPNTETWTQMRIDKVFDEIYVGLAWWEAQMPNGRLDFTVYSLDQQPTSYEPISRSSSDQDKWVGEILNNLGYASGDYIQDVIDLNNDVRNTYGKDWAYTAFVVDSFADFDGTFDNGVSGYAFGLGGPFMVMTYDNNGWGINNMDKVMAHETGHMFYASDEYTRPGEWSGYLNVLEIDNSGCIMDTANWCISSGTRGQIGWRDSDGDNIMDPEDTIPNTVLDPQLTNPTTNNVLTYTGTAEEIALTNQNPYYNSWLNGHRVNAGNDVSINDIILVQYRVDGGVWLPTTPMDGAFDGAFEGFTFTTSPLSDGSHTIETRARNTVGNWEDTYSVDTIMIDTTPPTTSIDLDGTPGSNGWHLTDVTVTLMAYDAGTGVQYTKYKLNGGGWQDYLGPFVVNGDGTFALEYYSVDNVDHAETFNSIDIKIDTADPGTVESPSGILGLNGWWTSNVTMTLSAADLMSGPEETLYSIDGGAYQSYTGPFLVSGDWTHSISYYSTDFAGNVESLNIIEIKIDAMAPNTVAAPSGTLGSNNWYLSSVTLNLDSVDSGSGIDEMKYRLDSGTWLDYVGPFQLTGNGVHDIEYYSTDYAGNVEVTKLKQLKIDAETPSTASTPSGTSGLNGWYTSGVTLELVESDTISGVESTFYRVDNGAWQVYTGAFLIDGDGSHTVRFYSVDFAGNAETTTSIQLWIDTELPSTSEVLVGAAGTDGWFISDVTVNLTGSDETSGVDETKYRIDGGTWQTYAEPFSFSVDGTYFVEFYSEDLAGNEEGIKSIQVKVDTFAPSTIQETTGTVGTNEWHTADITITLTSSDATSGVKYTQFRIDGGAWQEYDAPVTMTSDGIHMLVFRSIDKAGNVEDALTIEVKLDSTSPIVDLELTDDGDGTLSTSTATVVWTGSDETSGIRCYEVRIDAGAYAQVNLGTSHVFTGIEDGAHTITVRAVDNAGNAVEESIQFTTDTDAAGSAASIGVLLISIMILIAASIIILGMFLWRRRGKERSEQE